MTGLRRHVMSGAKPLRSGLKRGFETPFARLAAALIACLAAPALAQTAIPDLPSNQTPELIDVINDRQPGQPVAYARFRFLLPRLGNGVSFDDVAEDFQVLCDAYALPQVMIWDRQPDQIVISLSDRIVEFGFTDPGAVQFFEAFSIEKGACIWEPF